MNSGSPLSASTVVNVEEYINAIKEGQIKNYIWDAANSQWVRDPGTVVNISGLQITVDVSGDPVNVSGNWVNVSGATVIAKISGETVSISGNVVTVSGNWVNVSGATVISKISGETVISKISGDTVITSVSGNWVNVSGATIIAKVSGEVITVSGNAVTISGNWVNISGSYIYQRDTFVSYTSGMDLTVATSNTFVHMVTAPQPSYYQYTTIKIGASAGISTDIVTTYHTPADSTVMSGTVLTATTLDSGMYSLYIGMPSTIPYYPMALLSGDIIATSVPISDYITGDAITIRTVIKTV